MNFTLTNYLTLARYVDFALVLIFIVTIALVLLKAADLYFSKRLFGRVGLLEQTRKGALFGMTEAEHKKLVNRYEEGLEQLDGLMSPLATITALAPFVGLAGTVLHIMDALSKISGAALDISVISGPISTALFSTLMGIASAVVAGAAYNAYLRTIGRISSRCVRMINKAAP